MSEPKFGAEFAESFKDEVKKFKRDKITVKKIQTAVDKLMGAPYNHSQCREGNFKTVRKHRTGKLRLILAICEECRKKDYVATNSRYCPVNCESLPDNTLMFFHVDYRKTSYR